MLLIPIPQPQRRGATAMGLGVYRWQWWQKRHGNGKRAKNKVFSFINVDFFKCYFITFKDI